MRYRSILALVATLAITACSNDSTTPVEPVTPVATPRPSVLMVTVPDTAQKTNELLMYFGSRSIDSSAFGLGQSWLGHYDQVRTRSSVLDGGKTANLIVRTNGSWGYWTTAADHDTVIVLSDWKAENPEAHRGVVYSGETTFYIQVDRFGVDAKGNVDWENRLPSLYFTRTVTAGNAVAKVGLPAEAELRFIYISQLRSLGCEENDSLTMSSVRGLTKIVRMQSSATDETESYPSARMIAQCTMYDASAPANFASVNMSTSDTPTAPGRTARERVTIANGRYYMRLE